MNIRDRYIPLAGAAVLAGTLALVPATAQADLGTSQLGCETRETLVGLLEHSYAEMPIAAGLEDSGNVIEVLASRDGKSFTVLVTQPDGLTCVAATGEHWLRLNADEETGSKS